MGKNELGSHCRYIFVTGGVASSLGKGITASAVALILERLGYPVAMLKLEPYINIDPGTMSPFQHGEVYVTDDGAETDLDLGHYHRFTSSPLSRLSNVTTGQIYHEVIRRERKGDYLGKTVQVIPHITDEIKRRIKLCGEQLTGQGFVVAEVGGTVGDIESLPFLEAIRQMRFEHPKECLNIHVTYVPYIQAAQEIKTKPTQHSVQSLRQIGIFPEYLVCRCEKPLAPDVKEKISSFCNVAPECVFDAYDTSCIYSIPLLLDKSGITKALISTFNLPDKACDKTVDLSDWKEYVERDETAKTELSIGIVGKYVQHQDAYKSLYESLKHAANHLKVRLNLVKIDSEVFSDKEQGLDGYLIPGGFGERGWEGKIRAAEYCRTSKTPYFGICLGMQVMAVEFARNILGLKNANSTEMNQQTEDPVISLLLSQIGLEELGGTMRLGSYACTLDLSSRSKEAYRSTHIHERHRHRYEFNNHYRKLFQDAGMVIAGRHEPLDLVEILEVKDHPWMVGVQFHPEFLSTPIKPHPLFVDFLKASLKHREQNT